MKAGYRACGGHTTTETYCGKDFYCAVFDALNIPIGGSDESNLWADELFISATGSAEVQGQLTGRHHIAFQARSAASVRITY
jgi:hypothetical protein